MDRLEFGSKSLYILHFYTARMKYLHYQHANVHFVGMDSEEILGTVKYYREQRGKTGLPVPSRWNLFAKARIKTLEEISIECFFPMGSMHQFIDAEVREGFNLHVNANAFTHIRNIVDKYEERKRGQLYKFSGTAHLWFLPEYVMQGMREYYWKQHEAQVNEWLAALNPALERLRRENGFAKKADFEKREPQPMIVFTKPIGSA